MKNILANALALETAIRQAAQKAGRSPQGLALNSLATQAYQLRAALGGFEAGVLPAEVTDKPTDGGGCCR